MEIFQNRRLTKYNEKLRKERRYLKQRVWKLEKGRGQWKSKRKPTKKAMKQKRKTVLNEEQDVMFEIQFHISSHERKKMKKFFREHGIDFFAKNRLRNALKDQIAPKDSWTYKKVTKNIFQNSNCFFKF